MVPVSQVRKLGLQLSSLSKVIWPHSDPRPVMLLFHLSHLHICIKDTQLEPIKGELKERTTFSLVLLLEFKTFVRRTNSPIFQVFQKELGKRTGTVQVLKRSGRELIENSRDDTTWVKGQLQELSTRWDTVCKLSDCKQSRLEQALKQVRQHRGA